MQISHETMKNLALKTVTDKAPPGKLLKKVRALQNRGQFQESLKICEKLTSQGYVSFDLLHFHGLALRGCDQPEAALLKLDAALKLRPTDATIYNSLGVVFLQMKETEAAIELFKQATKLNQKSYDAWKNLGIALRVAERYQAAVVAFTCAHHIDKKQVEPLLNIVYVYIDVRQYKRAEEAMDQLLANCSKVTPDLMLKRMLIAVRLEDLDFLETHYGKIDRSNLNPEELAELDHCWAYFLESTGRYDEAIELLEYCIQEDTSHRMAFMTHLGLCYSETGRLDKAIALHEDIVAAYPEFVEARYNLAFLHFKNGELAKGYENFEARWQWREFPSKRRQFDAPQWNGESLDGKRLLVWREQGIGDEVRYASMLQDLEQMGTTVTFECAPKLQALWEKSFPWATIREEGPLNCINDPDYTCFDFQIPVGSLATSLRPSLQSYDELQHPWIARNASSEANIREKLGITNNELLVGLCWRSSNQAASRDKYFLTCEQLQPFANFDNIRWVNVQYDAERDEIETFRNLGIAIHDFTDLDQKDDLVGACNLLGACDAVITIGGSVADLAGGLGVPMIYMTAENSEAFLGTDRVPWFKNCKSYPIKAFRGSDTIAKVAQDWPEIAAWARNLVGKRDAPSNLSAPLDLEFHA